SNEDLERLFDLLLSFKDINGKFPIFTPMCILGNPDFDTNLEYDDDGRPMMGRAVLVDEEEIKKEQIEMALGAPIYNKGGLSTIK
ncbi:MAG: hypothetical protein EBS86_16645, partial [Crocinitomicaceae bacterium]|nr:hypothetical protein [Crocinitomicaceae bacterium]